MSENKVNRSASNKKKASSKKVKFIKIFTIILWIALITKWFFFDYESYIIHTYFNNYAWINYIKIFQISIRILLCIIAFILIKQVKWVLYVVFYPLIFVIWKIPFYIIKHKCWFIAMKIVNSIIIFFSSLRYYAYIIPVYIISLILVFKSSNNIILAISIAFLTIIIFTQIIKKIIHAFKPSYVIKSIKKMNNKAKNSDNKIFKLDDELKGIPRSKYSDEQLEKWTRKLQSLVLTNRLFLLLSKKFNFYKKTSFSILSLLISLFALMLLIIITFTVINYGIYKIDSTAFAINLNSTPKLFNFLFYSFNALLHSNIDDIIPKSMLAQIINMAEFGATILTSGILLSLLVPLLNNKRNEEFELLTSTLEKKSTDMEEIVIAEFNMGCINEAIEELQKSKASLLEALKIINDYLEN